MAFVNIIVLQYGNSVATLNCLKALESQVNGGCRVLVIDNASPETDKQAVHNWCAAKHYFTFEELAQNHGYAGGNSIGIAHALANNADYVFVLNNDCIVESDTIKNLTEFMERHPKFGAISPIINEHGTSIFGGKVHWLRRELSHLKTNTDPDYLTGAAMFLRREVLERVGAFDQRYFLYFEDADLSLRLRAAGWQIGICPTAQARHMASSSTSSLGSHKLLRYHARNSLLFNAKNGPARVKFLVPLWGLKTLITQYIKMLWPQKRLAAKAIAQGVLDYYFNRFGLIT